MKTAKKILELLEKKQTKRDRKRVSLYLSAEILDEFKEATGEIPASKVMEELMLDFIEDKKKKK